MPSGFAHAGACYSQKQAAVESFAASAFPRVSQAGECLYVQSATVSGTQLVISSQVAPATCSLPASYSFAPDFPVCDQYQWTPAGATLSVADAAQVCAAIVVVWCVAFGFKAIFRTLRADDRPAEE